MGCIKCKNMSYIFAESPDFNQDLSKWKVSDKADTENMFQYTPLENKENVGIKGSIKILIKWQEY